MPELAEKLSERLRQVEEELAELRRNFDAKSGEGALVDLLLRDNAKRRDVEQQLVSAHEWIQFAQEVGGVGAYTFDVLTNELRWSPSTYALYGWPFSPKVPDLGTWLSAVHPDDRAQVQEVAQAAIQFGREVRQEYRIVHEDGTVRWIQDRGRVTLNSAGDPLRVFGINIDITENKKLEENLRAAEETFRYTFEGAAVGVAKVGTDGRFLTVNPALCRLLGRSRGELMSLTFQDITHPDDLAIDLNYVQRALAGEIDSYTLDKRYLKPDGTVVWAELTVALRTENGLPANFISIVTDIGRRKEAELRAEFALGELAHRSRNLLMVVQSLVRQTARGAPDVKSMTETIEQRLAAMAASQDLLVANSAHGAPLRALVKQQLASFIDPMAGRAVLSGDDIALNAEATEVIGLALHELATNACKYGALSIPDGQVEISWSCTESDGESWLRLEWREVAGPKVSAPRRRGFGRRVIEQMVQQRLKGKVSLDFAETGLVWRVDAPGSCFEGDTKFK